MLTKTANVVWYFAFVLCLIAPASSQMVITGVIDGPLTGGTPKAIEVYALEDIPDLSIYGIGSANNGDGSDGEEFTFPAVAATKGQYLFVSHESVEFLSFFGFAPNYIDYTSANINGDDAIELFRNGAVIDVFGDINKDGSGEPWDYEDGWAYRKDGTDAGGTTFEPDNWIFSGKNALDGETTNASAATPFPIGTYEPPVAVRLVSFFADIEHDKTIVTWETANETNCAGFYVLSAPSFEGPFQRENDVLIMAQGGVGMSRIYTFEIMPPQADHICFQLEEITLDGASYFYPPVQASRAAGINELASPMFSYLLENYPNPFNSSTIISYSLQTGVAANVQILDLRGRPIRNLVSGWQSAGLHQVQWNGIDDHGQEAGSGVYFYRLVAGDFRDMKKTTLLR